jgi:hypothetical protein
MTASSTYDFGPAASGLMLTAFGRIGRKPAELTAEHLRTADIESNLVQVQISSKQPNLWKSGLYTQVLTPGTATYALPARMIAIQSAFITITSGSVSRDRIIWPLSTTEYAALPDKAKQAPPTSYWYDRQITPQITMWPVPDAPAGTTYTLKLRILSQPQDVSLKSGLTVDAPYRWLDFFVAGLSHRLSRHYARDLEPLRKVDAKEAWDEAAAEDQERVAMHITPQLSGYYR